MRGFYQEKERKVEREEQEIVAHYWVRDESAIEQTASKYGRCCHAIAYDEKKHDIYGTVGEFWDEDSVEDENGNRIASGFYQDTIFDDITPDDLWKYQLYGDFCAWTTDTKGNWQITFPLK